MIPKKSSTRRLRSKLDEDCYDASSLEENYDLIETEEDKDDADYLEDSDIEDTIPISVTVEAVNVGPKKRGPKPSKTQFYVEPKEFDDAIMRYYSDDIISDELALMINKIANKLSYATNFINYSYKDEMIGDAIVRMMKALIARKYTHNKGSNPFSYFTKIAFNAFRNRIKKEKHAYNTLQEYQEEIIMSSENSVYYKSRRSLNEDINSFIEE